MWRTAVPIIARAARRDSVLLRADGDQQSRQRAAQPMVTSVEPGAARGTEPVASGLYLDLPQSRLQHPGRVGGAAMAGGCHSRPQLLAVRSGDAAVQSVRAYRHPYELRV